MDKTDIYLELKTAFERAADPEKAAAMAAYMRSRFIFYGIPTPERKALYKDFIKDRRKTKRVDWPLLDRCWEDEHREFQYFVIDYLYELRKSLSFEDMPRLETYARTRQWWDSIDLLNRVVEAVALADRRMDGLMLDWSRDGDFWLRRIAIDHQLGRRERTDTRLLEEIILNNLGSDEFFINKSIGWALRDYAKTDPKWVRDFLTRHMDEMDKLSVREAGKYI